MAILPPSVVAQLVVDVSNGNSPYTISSGTIGTGQGEATVGNTGIGVLNQTGGMLNASSAILGRGVGSSGTYNLSGSAALNAQLLVVGLAGEGAFTQTGGSVNLGPGLVALGQSGGGGVYDLGSGGTLTASQIEGFSGASTFNFNGGIFQATENSDAFISNLGRANVRNGGVKIDSSNFNVTVPQALVHSGVAGDSAGDGGLTKLGAGTLTLSGANTYTGNTVVSAGALNLTGSITNTSLDNLIDGAAAAAATLNIASSGTLTVRYLSVGKSGSGGVMQAGGSLNLTYNLLLGEEAGSSGSYALSGGSITLGSSLLLGYEGTGRFTQTAGSFTCNQITLGFLVGSSGSYSLSGTGSLSAVVGPSPGIFVYYGSFEQTGGTAAGALRLSTAGTYSLGGGTLLTSSIIGSTTGGKIGTVNFAGGLLKSSASTASFLSGLATVNVRTGGVNIDTNGFNDTVTQALLHSTVMDDPAIDGGLNKSGTGALTLAGANTYTGGTIVSGGELVAGASGTLGPGGVSVLSSAVRLTIAPGVTDAISDTARLTLAGGGAAGVADVGYLQLDGAVETVGSLLLGSVLYTAPGIFTSATYPEYLSGAGSLVVVPEPSTAALLAFGLLLPAVAWVRLRRARPSHSHRPAAL